MIMCVRVGVCVLLILGASGACGGVWHAVRSDVRCRPNSCITVLVRSILYFCMIYGSELCPMVQYLVLPVIT
jgi:hypothetical protein